METWLAEVVSKAEELAELSWPLRLLAARPLALCLLALHPLPSPWGNSGETDLDYESKRVSGLTETGDSDL